MFQKTKKIELHVHLDGSLRLKTIAELTGKTYEEVKQACTVEKNCKDLKQYLEKFELPLMCMQTKENLTRVTKELVEDLEKENVIYAEIRFSPLLHTRQGLSLEEVVEAVLKGLNQEKVRCNLILCLMRGFPHQENEKVIYLAQKYMQQGVCAIDLAGSEAQYQNELYLDLFQKAQALNIPFTIHAGEARGKESIYSAISMGAQRIGHGVHVENDKKLLQKIKEKNILLEICPTSNLQTQAISAIKKHPIFLFYEQHIPISINTDNRTVSQITLTKEFHLLNKTFHWQEEDFLNIQKIALQHAFLPEEEKRQLLSKLLS